MISSAGMRSRFCVRIDAVYASRRVFREDVIGHGRRHSLSSTPMRMIAPFGSSVLRVSSRWSASRSCRANLNLLRRTAARRMMTSPSRMIGLNEQFLDIEPGEAAGHVAIWGVAPFAPGGLYGLAAACR